ncbi:NifU family protein [Nocardioides pacificus]
MIGAPRPVLVPVHPESVAGEPRALRWVMPGGVLPTGRLVRAPGRLGSLLADATITAGLVEHAGLWLWLRADLSWGAWGAAVRSALHEALEAPTDWEVEPAPDEIMRRVAADVLAGPAGDYVRSHGGLVDVADVGADVEAGVEGGVLVLELGGACAGCPAMAWTLRDRLETALRKRLPDLVAVHPAPSPRARPFR